MNKITSLYLSKKDAQEIAKEWDTNSLMDKTLKSDMDQLQDYLNKDEFHIPQVGGVSGSEIATQHTKNIDALFFSARLYFIFEDPKYLYIARSILLSYAKLYPTLEHVPALTPRKALGFLNSQSLDDQTSGSLIAIAYSYIGNELTKEEQLSVENGIFKKMVVCFTEEYPDRFDFIHNVAMWACACVGLMGIVTNNDDWVDKSLYGLNPNGERGFMRQVEALFSPDGCYVEGPFYQRYAIYPLYLFMEGLKQYRPDLEFTKKTNDILAKSFITLTDMSYEDGRFIRLNDSFSHTRLTSFEYSCVGLLIGNAISSHYLNNPLRCLEIAHLQQNVWVNSYGLDLSNAYKSYESKENLSSISLTSKNFTHGENGLNGGVSLMRSRSILTKDLTSISLDYGMHGLSHGHFDALGITYHNHKQEVLRDYGCARWNSIAYKRGGMYTDENDSYVKHSVAHNTVIVDESSHCQGNTEKADLYHGKLLFSNYENDNLQYVCAKYDHFSDDVLGKRLIITWKDEHFIDPIVIDLFSLESKTNTLHTYDLPFHYQGHAIYFNKDLHIDKNSIHTLGNSQGYQHLFKEKYVSLSENQSPLFCWLHNQNMYSIISNSSDDLTIIMGRTGANDPQSNLRVEPFYMLRQKAINHTFINLIESHSHWDQGAETCTRGGISVIKSVEKIYEDHTNILVNIHSDDTTWLLSASLTPTQDPIKITKL